jgi:uncharacterized protein YktB (UPF0637 family)
MMTTQQQPRNVLVDLFEELRADDPLWLAEQVQNRLAEAGFAIEAADTDLKREVARLQEVKRAALLLADERAKEANELRQENARLKAQLGKPEDLPQPSRSSHQSG